MEKHKVKAKQFITEMCFGCGQDNHNGLHGAFYTMEDGKTVALFQPGDAFQGYPWRLHGGITAAMLDETLGRAILALEPDCWAVTADLNVRYKKPIPMGVPLKVVAEVTENKRRLFRGSGELLLPDGEVAATASGVFMKQRLLQIAEMEHAESAGATDGAGVNTTEETAASRARIELETDLDYIEY